jgi:regulator of sirC expression with transglutaminase-like and TPR domain
MLPAQPEAPWWHQAFVRVVHGSNTTVNLTRAAYLLSAHRSALIRDDEQLEARERELEILADGCAPTFEGWQRRLFVDYGLSGNGIDYHDVRNSFLADVLDRRVGIPISLAVIGLDLAGRIRLRMWGVNFPGHFLLATADAQRPFVDPFNGGATLQTGDCADLHERMFGNRNIDPNAFTPALPETILIRMLMNLKSNYARARDLDGLTAVMRMRSALPSLQFDEARELVRLLDATGSWNEAMSTLRLLRLHYPMHEETLDDEETRLAARLN